MAYDSVRNITVMFGGGDKDEYFNDTWEFACIPPCYPDFDQSGQLDFFDFLTFLNLFNEGDPKADCDLFDGLNFFDFLCFANAFNEGC